MKLYLSGPLTNTDDWRERFAAAESQLLAAGFDVFNPADLSDLGDDATLPRAVYMRRDIEALLKCDGIALLDGWTESPGALLETSLAAELGIRLWNIDGWESTAPRLTMHGAPSAKTREALIEVARKAVEMVTEETRR